MVNSLISETNFTKMFHSITAFGTTYRIPILGGLISGLLAYGFAFTNKLVNPDDLFYLFSKGATIESGRWGLVAMSWIFPDRSMPWIYGIISLVLLTISVCFCIRMLNVQNKLLQLLLAAITVTFPSQISTFAYMFTASSYAVAFLLAVLAAYFLRSGKKGMYLVALLCAAFSVSIYQAYISITASLLVLCLIYDVLNTQESEKNLLLRGIRYVFFLALSLGVYWVITKLVWVITGISIGYYADSALAFDIRTIPIRIVVAYIMFYRMLYGKFLLITNSLSFIIHSLLFLFLVLELIIWGFHHKKTSRILLLIFLLGILPLSIGCMYLFVGHNTIHTLVMYSFVIIYYLAAILMEAGQFLTTKFANINKYRSHYYDFVLFGFVVIIASNVYAANDAYLNMYLRYENTYSFATSAITTLHNMPDFSSDSKVAIAGNAHKPSYWDENDFALQGLVGVSGISPSTYSIASMFEYYNGIPLNFVSDEELDQIMETTEYAEMPVYPCYGSIRKINDVFVIKLSDNSNGTSICLPEDDSN